MRAIVISIGVKRVDWLECEVFAWLQARRASTPTIHFTNHSRSRDLWRGNRPPQLERNPVQMTFMPRNFDPLGLIDIDEIEYRVVFSRMHIWRLEKDGKFPNRVQIRSNRVAWLRSEVLGWMQEKVDRRPAPPFLLQPHDRFITVKQTRELSTLSKETIDRLEQSGAFPCRVRIGTRRIAWLEREIHAWKASL